MKVQIGSVWFSYRDPKVFPDHDKVKVTLRAASAREALEIYAAVEEAGLKPDNIFLDTATAAKIILPAEALETLGLTDLRERLTAWLTARLDHVAEAPRPAAAALPTAGCSPESPQPEDR